jgi:hypothetical protein
MASPKFPVVLKNMKAGQFGEFLYDIGACGSAREWAEGKSFKQVWKTCKNPEWLEWLIERMVDNVYAPSAAGIKEWGGTNRFTIVTRRARKACAAAYEAEHPTWNKMQKAQCDAWRKHYVVE